MTDFPGIKIVVTLVLVKVSSKSKLFCAAFHKLHDIGINKSIILHLKKQLGLLITCVSPTHFFFHFKNLQYNYHAQTRVWDLGSGPP